jgi:hypothetical protein
MINIKGILEGHINELRSKIGVEDQEKVGIFQLRATICNSCPLKKGNTCNPKLFINPETKEVFTTPKKGFVKGCGCRLSAKQRSTKDKCPAHFWGGEFDNTNK